MTTLQIIYASAATKAQSGTELKTLLQRARENNAKVGVSGILVYHEGSFLQVLEGPENHVSEIFDKIGRDPRHTQIKLLFRDAVSEGEFRDWSMGFVDTTASAHQIDGFVTYQKQLHDLTLDKTRAKKLLRMFQEGSWRQKVGN
jgi:hypothetical protein